MKLRSKVSVPAISGVSIFFGLVNPALAGLFTPVSAPTLDETGLIGLGAAVGIAGLITLIRRNK